jgi:ABC-type Fe3+/spermidine/putrescine transport system ATPase subunit
MGWLQVQQLVKLENGLKVLEDVSFTMQKSERLAIMGETGSGKTSVLKIIAGLMQPDAGTVLINGEKVLGPFEKLLPGHPRIAFLSQYFELRPNFYVYEILEYANQLKKREAAAIYELCEITHLLGRKTTQLSGGEKQRIALARQLTTLPSLLLLDEPFSHLDYPHKQIIKKVIETASQKMGFSSMLVSHDPADVLPWATRILILQNGRIIEEGTPQSLYHSPSHVYTADLLGSANWLSDHFLQTLPGKPPEKKFDKWMVRPEFIGISKENNDGISGIIQSIQFNGGHFHLDISIGKEVLKAQTTSLEFSTGENICIAISFDNIRGIDHHQLPSEQE